MKERTDWTLIVKYLSDECCEAEKNEVEAWIASSEKNRKFVEIMRDLWNEPRQPVEEINIRRMWDELSVKAEIKDDVKKEPAIISLKQKGNILTKMNPATVSMLRYAAVIMVIALPLLLSPVGFDIFNFGSEQELLMVNIKPGEKSQMELKDGSLVTLGAGSQFQYADKFDEDERHVYLSGEGFFEITSNPDKPFFVHAGNAIVKVVGTKFNVRAWEIEKRVNVTVSEGSVFMSNETDEYSGVMIGIGQASYIQNNGLPAKPEFADVDKVLGWMENRISFDNKPMKEILFHLSRIYNLNFSYDNSELGEEELTLHIESIPVNEMLEMISLLTDSDYRMTGNNIAFFKK